MASSLVEHDIPESILFHILKMFSLHCKQKGNDYTFQLCRKKISQFYAHHLLEHESMDGLSSSLFLSRWQEALPEDFPVELEFLSGIAYVDSDGLDKCIRYYPKSQLDMDPKIRFQQLFQERKKWSRQDILPFISDLAETEKKLDVVLLKFTRSVKEKGMVFYSCR
jgi:sister chromatid cohesion protein DCC1